ncbi:MAG: exodeoxyribonuclease VII small subunit [Clostridiales bacterium]|nr:exodeoxyribonuclease VII small subunit [Clostridiales bacterium]
MAQEKMTFEQSMERLNAIVRQLEKGEAPLSESLALFEEGTALIAACGKMLDEAEQKVVMLRKGENGEPVEMPFEGGE